MIAILSDIHANLEALEAVLADIEQFNVEAIYCLGDLVGYGPDPIACLQLAMSWQLVLLGEHDAALRGCDELEHFGIPMLNAMHRRSRQQLRKHRSGPDITVFLWQLPSHLQLAGQLYVHGSPRESYEFIFPEDIYNEGMMAAVTSRFEQICFCGHTHIPGIFRAAELAVPTPQRWSFLRRKQPHTKQWDYVTPEECGHEYPLSGEKLICNVGSVGQPRDNDPRAGYVLYSPEVLRFRRVKYDVEKTIRKIHDGPDDNMFGDRLLTGR